MKKILYATTAFILCGIAQSQAACIATPSCTTLGYTETSSCDGGLKCPFGSYWYCPSNSGSGGDSSGSGSTDDKTYNCKIGDIFYSDWSCSTDLVSGKTPIAIVAYMDGKGHGQALALESIGTYHWQSNATDDLVLLYDYSTEELASKDFSSCINTQKLMASGDTNYTTAAWVTSFYKTTGTKAEDWCLPAAGIFTTYYNNQASINSGFDKVGGTKFTSSTSAWTSTEKAYTTAWKSNFNSSNYGLYAPTGLSTNKTSRYEVRPVLEF